MKVCLISIISGLNPSVRFSVFRYDMPASIEQLSTELLNYEHVQRSVWVYNRCNSHPTVRDRKQQNFRLDYDHRWRESNKGDKPYFRPLTSPGAVNIMPKLNTSSQS